MANTFSQHDSLARSHHLLTFFLLPTSLFPENRTLAKLRLTRDPCLRCQRSDGSDARACDYWGKVNRPADAIRDNSHDVMSCLSYSPYAVSEITVLLMQGRAKVDSHPPTGATREQFLDHIIINLPNLS
ncbi:hypothetical protein FOXG_20453 [Fusarium oxysporum f. sp. lycopersici 4287]|uniref:Uncharacterized protein n=2 Tax=Fusarium oxysporum TaxID=5507 RepID=A0A0J9WQM8_FUSO4|nr:hypothetical protein FOXG_20453 [Fusarium oxysporum f. sp. lycopersici 4287]EXK46673.1 hypothetical protein FOMG_00348 [Fusarium oxysporum f. sp. melonis 26406]KNB11057.1 hypothetical protein FOXG_20453 [Fusarium oxysporum f. sp. lycopersici 4287]